MVLNLYCSVSFILIKLVLRDFSIHKTLFFYKQQSYSVSKSDHLKIKCFEKDFFWQISCVTNVTSAHVQLGQETLSCGVVFHFVLSNKNVFFLADVSYNNEYKLLFIKLFYVYLGYLHYIGLMKS